MNALFLGGDLRQKFAAEFLNKNSINAECHVSFCLDKIMKDKIRSSDVIVFPIPVLKKEKYLNISMGNLISIYEVTDLINDGRIVFGGKFTNELKNSFSARNLQYVDFLDIEAFQIQNALLTAEGAIHYGKEKLERSIHGSEVAILGFGRIGKILAYLLRSQGAKITVCARKDSDFAWSKLGGLNGFKIKNMGNKSNLNLINIKYDLIFNTIPFWIMDEEFAQSKNNDAVIVDLASYPFGIDEGLVEKYNLKYYRELGIPGRYAPQSAGEIIGQTILNNIFVKEN